MTPSFRELERRLHRVPLGLRFWDVISQSAAVRGLTVTARRLTEGVELPVGRNRSVAASEAPSGAYAFHHLEGMRDAENGGEIPQRRFRIEVRDDLGRYLPFRLDVMTGRDPLFAWVPASPNLNPAPPGAIPLFPTAARQVPREFASLRAELWDVTRKRSAAWGVLDVASNGRWLGTGVADSRGRVLVAFAYPPPPFQSLGSPGGSPPLPLSERSWPVTVSARSSAIADADELPDLNAVFAQQPVPLWEDDSASRELGPQVLTYRTELTVTSRPSPLAPSGSLLLSTRSPL